MSETKALTVQMSLQDTLTLGKVLAESKRFTDATNPQQAVVKVMAGQELGFGPIASMCGIYVIKGRVTISANMMAQAVKRSGRYDYRVVEMTGQVCEIGFFEGGKHIGTSVFTAQDAAKAGTQNMVKFPRNMLFARAMSNGVKWYCPDVFQTGVYTPEELGVQVDGDGEILDVQAVTIIEPPPATYTNGSVDYEGKPDLTPHDPGTWDTLAVPENYTDLYNRVHELGIDEASPSGRRKHAANIIKQTYPDNGASAADAWQAIITHQQAKQADVKTGQAEMPLVGAE